MKTKFILIFVFLFSLSTNAQWIQTKGPYGAMTKCLTANNDYIFTAIYGQGLFRSNDKVVSWVEINNGLLPITDNLFYMILPQKLQQKVKQPFC
jgi:hypothetical protein